MSAESRQSLVRDTFGRPLKQPAPLGHRPLQPALPVLHAGRGLRLAAARRAIELEELELAVEVFTGLGVGSRAAHRRRAAAAARPGSPGGHARGQSERIHDLALTTNGVLLAEQAEALKRAGLHRLTISLDTLRPERFRAMTRRDDHARVLAGIEAARARRLHARPSSIPSSCAAATTTRLADLIEFGRARDIEVRFIEYMDVAGATRWSPDQVVSRDQMLEQLSSALRKDHAGRGEQLRPGRRAMRCPTARSSASSPRPPRRSAAAATAAA